MQVMFLTVPFDAEKKEFSSETCESLFMNHAIEHYKVEFFIKNEKPYWAIFLHIASTSEKNQKNEGNVRLNENQQAIMKSLKTWRKQKAFEEGIPPYLIATNSQFIHAISENCSSKEQLKLLKGFGQKRIQKYGADILKIIKKGQLNENDQ